MNKLKNDFKNTSNPIGIFDSGVGGLTVMQQLVHTLPHERLIYFGDTARLPYGNKSSETIIRYSIDNTIMLLEKNIKLLVIACNTASAFALPKLRQLFNLPILGVIDAGAEKAVSVSKNLRIAVLGTKGTIESGAYQKAILNLSKEAYILPIACPLFVPLVEEQWLDHPATELIIHEYLAPIKQNEIDTILLGCTHYPLLFSHIQRAVGDHITIIDSATTCAEQAAKMLKETNLLSPIKQGRDQYLVSDDPKSFQKHAERLFGQHQVNVELCKLSI